MKPIVNCDDVLNAIGINMPQYLSLAVVSMEYFCFSALMLLPVYIQGELIAEYELSRYSFSLVYSIPTIISVITTPMWGRLSDMYGRRWPLFIGIFGMTVVNFALCFAINWTMWVITKSICSLFMGAVWTMVFTVSVEIFPIKNRARWVNVVSFFGSFGVLIMALINLTIRHVELPFSNWRLTVVSIGVINLITAIGHWFFVFETPRYWLVEGQEEKAWDAFQNMVKSKGNLNDYLDHPRENCKLVVSRNVEELTEGGSFSQRNKVSRVEDKGLMSKLGQSIDDYKLIFVTEYRFHSLLCVAIALLHVCGYLGLLYFVNIFYARLGQDPSSMLFWNAAARFPGLALCSYLMDGDHWFQGRVATMRWLSGGMTCLLAVMTVLTAVDARGVGVLIPSVFLFFFALPIYAVLAVFYPETYPTAMRTTATSVMTAAQFFPGIVLPFFSAWISVLSDKIGRLWIYPMVWGVFYFVLFLTTFLLIYDKKNMKLDDEAPQKH